MSNLFAIMKSYVKEPKNKIDFNRMPEKVLRFSKDVSIKKIRECYFVLTGKNWVDKPDIEIIQEMIFILLKKLRGDY